jgi:deazaflavin-dependent oxidoreductase (nitroreductase family)
VIPLVDALGYSAKDPNPVQRSVQSLAATKPAAWVTSKLLAPMDRWLLQASNGRTTFAGILAGLPVITLTSTGAKSGLPRTTPLTGVPIQGSLAILGTNYGQRAAPAWTYNLAANPNATVAYRTAEAPVVARYADDEEFEYAFDRAAGLYPGYRDYRSRVSDRPIRVFILDYAHEDEGP